MKFSVSKWTPDWRVRYVTAVMIACGVMLCASPVSAQLISVYFQCEADGANLNENEGLGEHLGWGSVRSYLEPAQRDMQQDGSGAGYFQHGGITVVKFLSVSSPRYMDALYQNTTLDSCTVEFYHVNPVGAIEKHFEVELSGAKVSLIEIQGSDQTILEEITFRAQSIVRRDILGATSSQQNLGTPP